MLSFLIIIGMSVLLSILTFVGGKRKGIYRCVEAIVQVNKMDNKEMRQKFINDFIEQETELSLKNFCRNFKDCYIIKSQ